MASSNLTQALLLGGMGGGGMMSPMGLGMYDPAALGAMQRLGLGQSMVQEGMSSSPAYPAQALSRLGQSLIGALMMRHGFSDLQDINKQQAAEIPALDAYIHPPAAAPTSAVPAAAGAPPTSTASFPTQIATMESGGNNAASNPLFPITRGGPLGPQQFTAGTWGGFAKANPQLFMGMTPEQVMASRTDPNLSAQATDWLKSQNAPVLQGYGITPSPANLGVAHALGGAGAAGVLALPDETPLSQAFQQTQPDKAQAILSENPQYQKMTVGDLKAKYAGLDTPGGATAPSAAAPSDTAPPAAAPSATVQTGMQNPQVQGLWETIKRITQQQSVLSPFDIKGQKYLQGQLELANKQLDIGNVITLPDGRQVNTVTGQQTGAAAPLAHYVPTPTGSIDTSGTHPPTYMPSPRPYTTQTGDVGAVGSGGQNTQLWTNPSKITGTSDLANAARIIATVGPQAANGSASPQDLANLQVATTMFQRYQLAKGPQGENVSLPTQSVPTGLGAAPPQQEGQSQQPSGPFQQPVALGTPNAAGVTTLTPGNIGPETAKAIYTSQAGDDAKQIAEQQALVMKNHNILGTTSTIRQLAPEVATGAAADAKLRAAQIFTALGVPEKTVQEWVGTDAPAGEILQKKLFELTTGAVRGMGAREPGSVMLMFQKNYPQLSSRNMTIDAMSRLLDMDQVYQENEIGGRQHYLSGQIQNVAQGKGYEGLSGYQQPDPKLYQAAALATGGMPYSVWSKGLTSPQQTQALQLGAHVYPDASALDANGVRHTFQQPAQAPGG